MHLKRLEIQGFKTFANRTVFEFRPGTVAIVGPNGSGKSNVADAVRWVLGEQSYSNLRSKRLEDLIFSGGGKRAPAGFAEVSLTIDNSDRLLALPYGEVTITRRATRSGDSEYQINRSKVRLRDIQDATAPLGGSYTIINQGLVDSALTLRPDERRQLFEDAAAIGVYQGRKGDAEGKLKETSANVERCADLLSELEPRLRSLKRQASLARTHRTYTQELRALLEEHYAQQWAAARAALHTAQLQEQAAETALAQRRVAQQEASAALTATRAALATLRDQLGALHHASSGLHTQAEAVQRDLAVGTERLAALARRADEARAAEAELAARSAELAAEHTAIQARIAAAEARLQTARSAVQTADAAGAAREQGRRALALRVAEAQRAELAAQAAQAEAERRGARAAAQAETLDRERTGQAETIAAAERALGQRRRELAAAEAALAAATAARAGAAQAEERARATIEAARADRARADEAVAAARRQLADLEARLESLTRLQRSYAGAFAGVKAAMQWAEQQRRSGFALVSSIIRTPAEIETAIEVALGSRLQNIVVERWEDAEQAIEALKRSGAGRATFLPLDSIRSDGRRDRQEINPPPSPAAAGEGLGVRAEPVLGVAAELVSYDPVYERVVWQLLGRTLVVRDLLTARAELRALGGGWSIVTLAGEQVNSGGAVTGGAQVKESGTLRRERELRELPEQTEQARADLAERQAVRAGLETALADAERALREADTARRAAAQAQEQQREAERGEGALEQQRRRLEQIGAELGALAELTEQARAERAQLVERERAAREQLAALRDEEARERETDAARQQNLAELRAALAAVEGELRTERALLGNQEGQIQRLEQQRAGLRQRAAEAEQERLTGEQQRAGLERRNDALLAEIDALRTQIDPAEAALLALETQRAAAEQHEAALAAALREAESAALRAQNETQRAGDRRDTLWERAAADDVDVETVEAAVAARAAQQSAADIAEISESAESASAVEEPADLQGRIQSLRSRIIRLGVINPLALEEYEEEGQRYEFLSGQVSDLRSAAESLRSLIAELDEAMQSRFTATFTAIAAEFENTFARLFGGGEAKLALSGDASGDFDALGVEISVRPPGKRQQNLALLSGGERALTAAALLFAILKVNPSPFCILDEVDAALDEANVGRFRDLLRDMADMTQFLLVTHNRGTIEAAKTIYGISMGDDGASRVLSLRLEELAPAT